MSKLVEIKTKPTASSVEGFITAVPDAQKRKDSFTLLALMQKITNEVPSMWGASIIGFGTMRYKSAKTGREVDWMKIGFSPRKANLTLYLGLDVQQHATALQHLGKHKTGVGCLYFNKLDDIDLNVLATIIEATVKK